MILVNCKIYRETWGEKVIELAKICQEVGQKSGREVIVTTTALDAVRVQKESGVRVWLQDVDEYLEGKHSGAVSMAQAVELGIKGSLINHSEKQKPRGTVLKIIGQKPEGFTIVCCVKSVGQIERWVAKAKPDYILYEPPELIGSSTESVATAAPKSIKNAVAAAGGVPLIVGAGVKSRKDVEVALKMGAMGVGLASGFVLSQNPKQVLEEIGAGFNGIL